MTPFEPGRLVRIGVLAVVLAAFAAPAWAQEEGEEPPPGPGEGGIISVAFGPAFTFDGKVFDGTTWYQEEGGTGEVGFLPKMDKHASFRGVLGFRKGAGALELGYERNHFNGSFENDPMGATFQAFNINGRVFLFSRSRVQPNFLIGASFPSLRVENGNRLSLNSTQVGDATWSGNGLNTEAGVTIYPVRRVGIGVGYSYRVFWFDRAESGVSTKQFELRPRFRETSGNLVFNLFIIV